MIAPRSNSDATMTQIHTLPHLLAGPVVTSGAAQARINTDGLWRGSGGLALSATSGNKRSNSLQLRADAPRATAVGKITLGAAANYASHQNRVARQTTSNQWSLFGQCDFKLTPRLFGFGRPGLDGDEPLDLDLRTGAAAGLGHKLIDTQQTGVEVFGGAGDTTDK